MKIDEAISQRIQELCNEQNMTINALASASRMSASTIYSILSGKSQNPGVVTLKMICTGFGISLREFFSEKSFDDLE